MNNSLARKGAGVFLTNWLLFPLQLATGVLVVRSLGAEGKGVLVILSTSAALIAALGQLGLPAAGIYYLQSGKYGERTLLANYLVVVVAASLLVTLFAVYGGDLFATAFLEGVKVDSTALGLALASVPMLMIGSFVSTLLLAKGDSWHYAQLTIGANLLSLVLTVGLVVILQLGVAGALFAALLGQGIMLAPRLWMLYRGTLGQSCRPSLTALSIMLRFGLKHYAGTVSSLVFKRSNNFLVAYYLSVQAVGYFSVAMTAQESILSIPRAVNTLLHGAATAQKTDSAMLVARATRTILWLMLAACGALALVSPWLVPLLYGSDFAQAVPPLWIMLASAVLLGFASNLQAYFTSIARPELSGIFVTIAGLISLLFSFWMIPAMGIVGSALALLLGALVAAILHWTWFIRLSHVPALSAVQLRTEDMMDFWSRFRRAIPDRWMPPKVR
jgi:O-antigen/teichoic acid export membrane protein